MIDLENPRVVQPAVSTPTAQHLERRQFPFPVLPPLSFSALRRPHPWVALIEPSVVLGLLLGMRLAPGSGVVLVSRHGPILAQNPSEPLGVTHHRLEVALFDSESHGHVVLHRVFRDDIYDRGAPALAHNPGFGLEPLG